MRPFFIPLMALCLSSNVNGQSDVDHEKLWSATDRLEVSDFQLEAKGNNSCFAQFSVNYAVNGFDFLTRNFNQKVKNVMYTNASWLDGAVEDTVRLLQFQQILFDLTELHVRKFREQLLVNRKKIANGVEVVEDMNARMAKELSEERARFEQESNGGVLTEVMDNWASRIERDLKTMDVFRYENTMKIKLEE